ncbi:MAG: LamG-like jellyroll fold domain-containing protein [Candidatus Omnitrophota bacterium]
MRITAVIFLFFVVMSLSMPSVVQADLNDGLVGWWTFDETQGAVAHDASGNGRDGTLMGNNGIPVWTTADCKVNSCLAFDGVDDYIKISNVPVFTPADNYSVAFWMKTLQENWNGAISLLNGASWGIYGSHYGKAFLYTTGVPSQYFYSQSTIPLGQWTHYVLTKQGHVYSWHINGELNAQQDKTASGDVTLNTGSVWKIGFNYAMNTNGFLDDVRIYNRVLTEREIKILNDPAVANHTTPPVIIQTYPVLGSEVPSWSRYDQIRVTTDEPAACRFSDKPGVAYQDMTGIFSIIDANTLAMDVKGLESGKSVTYYVRCRDKAANDNLSDTPVTLTVAEDHTPPEFWRINVPLIMEDTADILWSTTEITDGQLEWGFTAAYGNQSPVEVSKAIPHAVLLQHLQPDTTYHYRVKSADVAGNMVVSTDQTFTTRPQSTSVNFYVATNGSDTIGDGSLSKPFATLEKARDTVRAYKTAHVLPLGGITVWLRGGKYYRSTTFTLAAVDSGAAGSPVIYRSYPGETAVITGGKPVAGWSPAVNSPLAAYLNPAVISKIYVADLKAQSISYVATMTGDGSKYGMQFIFNGQPMILARYPNAGYVNIGNVVNVGDVDTAGVFNYTDNEPDTWHDTSKLWLSGYYYYGWAQSHNKVASLDPGQKLITMTGKWDAATPGHWYGFRTGQWYQYENIIEELDAPGEWYLDAASGLLYFYPPSDIVSGDAKISTVDTLITGSSNISYVTFRDIIMENARSNAVSISGSGGGTDVAVINSVIRNTGSSGFNAVTNTRNPILYGNLIYNTGGTALSIYSGTTLDASTLVPSYSEVISNKIYNTGVWLKTSSSLFLSGIEEHIAHNEVFNAPYIGISLSTNNNNNITEYNNIHDVMTLSQDGGAIYEGRQWTRRGNIIRYNYIHDIYGKDNLGAESIYLDDTQAGQTLWGNILFNAGTTALNLNSNAGSGIIGGGRDNIIENNIIVNMKFGVSLGVWNNDVVGTQAVIDKFNYKVTPFTTMYPELINLNNAAELLSPLGSTIRHNIFYQNYGSWLYQLYKANFEPIVDMRGNLIGIDPGFVSSPIGNFGLRPDSPAYALGFKPIPYEKIGLLKDSPIGVPWLMDGDVSGDGRMTMYDAALVLKYTVGGSLTGVQQAQADINGDTMVDAADADMIARKALGF